MTTETKYFYRSTEYQTLNEAKTAGQNYLNWLSQNPREYMQAKKAIKTGSNTYTMDSGDGLTNAEILANPEGVFLCSNEVDGELREVTDLALEVQESKNSWIQYQRLADFAELTSTTDENGNEINTVTLQSVNS